MASFTLAPKAITMAYVLEPHDVWHNKVKDPFGKMANDGSRDPPASLQTSLGVEPWVLERPLCFKSLRPYTFHLQTNMESGRKRCMDGGAVWKPEAPLAEAGNS
jgi:hypothetical protein